MARLLDLRVSGAGRSRVRICFRSSHFMRFARSMVRRFAFGSSGFCKGSRLMVAKGLQTGDRHTAERPSIVFMNSLSEAKFCRIFRSVERFIRIVIASLAIC